MAQLPRASTAVLDDPGIDCLRALTTCSLCYFEPNPTVSVLKRLIPSYLVEFELEFEEFTIDGPFLSGLHQYVKAVSVEEDSNLCKDHILKSVSTRMASFAETSTPEFIACESTRRDGSDMGLVIGVLEWILLPLISVNGELIQLGLCEHGCWLQHYRLLAFESLLIQKLYSQRQCISRL